MWQIPCVGLPQYKQYQRRALEKKRHSEELTQLLSYHPEEVPAPGAPTCPCGFANRIPPCAADLHHCLPGLKLKNRKGTREGETGVCREGSWRWSRAVQAVAKSDVQKQ